MGWLILIIVLAFIFSSLLILANTDPDDDPDENDDWSEWEDLGGEG